MRGCEPCQGRKAAAISIVSCVPWEFLPRAFYDLEKAKRRVFARRFLRYSAFLRFLCTTEHLNALNMARESSGQS